MPEPGFTPLGKVGLVNKGVFSSGEHYSKYDFVQYGDSTYMAKIDGASGTPEEGDSWQALAKGVTGTAAKITSVTVDVTNEVGEPSATVDVKGTDTERTLDFHFSNLKGETGAVGPIGPEGPVGPLGPQGLQGVQGEKGVGVSSLTINDQKHLEVTLTDTTTVDAGAIGLNKDAIVEGLGYEPVGGQGVNLLTGTKDFSGDGWIALNYWVISTEKYNGFTIIQRQSAYFGVHQVFRVKAGETYTFSGFVNAPVDAVVQFFVSNNGSEMVQPNEVRFNGTGNWERRSFTFEVLENGEIQVRMEPTNSSTGIVNICGLKLERGTVTDPIWTPAPEDIVVRSELEQAVTGENLVESDRFIANLLDNEISYGSDSSVPSGRYVSFMTKVNTRSSGIYTSSESVANANNDIYTLSFYAKANSDISMQFGLGKNRLVDTFGTSWKKYTFIGPFLDTTAICIYTNNDNTASTTIYISSLKLEKGYNSNPFFTVSPYDYQKNIIARLKVIEERLNISVQSEVSFDDMEIN